MTDKNKPKPLTLKSRDLIIEISSDQASQSNQLDKYPKDPKEYQLSKQEVSDILKSYLIDPIGIDDWKIRQALKIALTDLGKCLVCRGLGKVPVAQKPDSGYEVKRNKLNIYYLTQCVHCRGFGKQLSVKCASCGDDRKIMPDQRHFSYCQECESKLLKSGVLI